MKKLLLSLFALIFINFSVSAQDLPILDFGLKAGVNSSWMGGLESDGGRIGFVGGAFARFNVPVVGIFVQPELVFAQTGGKIKLANSLPGVSGEGEVNINTIDIPVLLGKRFGLSALGIRLGVGPVFSPVLSVTNADGDDVENTNDLLIGLQVGAGVDISKLNIDLRYHTGFTNIVDENPTFEGRPQAIQLTLGYKLF